MPDPFGMPPGPNDGQKKKRKTLVSDDLKMTKLPSMIKGSQTPGPKGKT